MIETLALHLQQQPPIDAMVWTTERGAFLRRGSFSRIWLRAVAASIGQPCRVHDLRHTHASWLIAAGEHLVEGLDEGAAERLFDLSPGPNADQTNTRILLSFPTDQ